ncbi:MAG TPA: nitronate monooxygenase [Acidimicrobiales bacterium]|nr:nitronate monooxygenase [Acidimicrobiales bacterium]
MSGLPDRLAAANPVLAAPMAGGPTTPAMVVAARRAESFGFLAGGYKSVDALASEMREVRASAPVFGVNLFAPNPLPVDPGAYRSYAEAIREEGIRFGLDLTSVPAREDDDGWAEKVALLLEDPVPVVGFTFGVPSREVVDALRRQGSLLVQTVTSGAEAAMAAGAGIDVMLVQSHEAGGHFGTLTPGSPSPPVALTALVTEVKSATGLPVIAAGGLGTTEAIREVLGAGAEAVMVGTHLLRTDESGASPTYKAALADRREHPTAVTRAFSGRPARGIRNGFMQRYEARAPLGYPAVHHLTSPLRRAAAAAGEPDLVNLWAGTAHASAPDGSVTAALTALAAGL